MSKAAKNINFKLSVNKYSMFYDQNYTRFYFTYCKQCASKYEYERKEICRALALKRRLTGGPIIL